MLIVRPQAEDEGELLAAVKASRDLHQAWVQPPSNESEYAAYLKSGASASRESFLVRCTGTRKLTGVVELGSILPAIDDSATIGWYAFESMAGKGLMREAIQEVMTLSFGRGGITRLFAEIDPANTRSISFVRRLGFERQDDPVTAFLADGTFRDYERWIMYARLFINISRGVRPISNFRGQQENSKSV